MPIVPLQEIVLLHNNICQAVTDPRRIQILYALSDGPCNVTALASMLDMPQSTVSRHLGILRQRGIVKTEREGASVVYSVANMHVIEILDLMRKLMRDVLDQQSDLLG